MIQALLYYFGFDHGPWRLFGALAMVLAPLLLVRRRWADPEPGLQRLSALGAWLTLAIAVAYPFGPGFWDGVEATVAYISMAFKHGQPIYPALGTGEEYGVPYGHWLFLIQSWCFGLPLPVFLAAKGAFAAAGAGSIVLAYRLVRRELGPREAWAVAGLLGWASLALASRMTGARGDALLVFFGLAGAWAALHPAWWAPLLLGALVGLASGTKLHGGLYLVPALWLSLKPHGWKAQWLVWPAAALAWGLPFLAHWVSWQEYLTMMSDAAKLSVALRWEWADNLRYWLWLLLLPGLAFFTLQPEDQRREALWALLLLGVSAMAAVIASRPGSGPAHLLPVAPFIFWAWARWRSLAPAGPWQRRLQLPWVLALALVGTVNVAVLLRMSPVAFDGGQRREVKGYAQAMLPETLAMAPRGSGTHSRQEFVGGIHIFQGLELQALGAPLYFERYTAHDRRQMGLPEPPDLIKNVLQGPVRAWLLPVMPGFAPFEVLAHEKDRWLYPVLQAEFSKQYRPVHRGQHFEIWLRQGLNLNEGQLKALKAVDGL